MSDQLETAFAELRRARPQRSLDAVRRVAARRRRRRGAAIAVAATACGLAVLVALPDSQPTPRSLAAVLRSAAAVADDQPPLDATHGYRYVRVLSQETFYRRDGEREGWVTVEHEIESWEDVALHGRTDLGPRRLVARGGDAALADALADFLRPGLGHAESVSASDARGGLGTVPRLSELPDDAAGLLAALEDRVRNGPTRWAPGLPTEPMVLDGVLQQATRLLLSAAVPPRLRAAAFLALGHMPGARALGRTTDPRGRAGEGVSVTIRNDEAVTGTPFPPSAEYEIVFDPQTSQVLAVVHRDLDRSAVEGSVSESTVLLASRQVERVGERR